MSEITSPIFICNRQFSVADLEFIRQLIQTNPQLNRTALSQAVCDHLQWFQVNGRRKDMTCRDALRRLEKLGLVTLPPPRHQNGNGHWQPALTPATAPQPPLLAPVTALAPLKLQVVTQRPNQRLWNEYLHRYHYLGSKPFAGAQLRYWIQSPHGCLGLLGFSAAAWKIAPRDRWLGWNDAQRVKNLPLIVGNSRFLIFPWVQVPHLASTILARVARQLPTDWQQRHGYQPVLLETFVEQPRFRGTCYRAANWIYVGQTQGRGKMDRTNQHAVPIKDIYLYPLVPNFRQQLTQN